MPDGSLIGLSPDLFLHGITDPMDRPLPPQNWDLITLIANRWARGTDAMLPWAEEAARCVNYYEGKQWDAADAAKLMREGRPQLTLNKIKPLVNLVHGYHLNNRTDRKALPASDGTGNATTAALITACLKNVSERNLERHLDAHFFMEGLQTGRAYMDRRMDYERNAFGDIKVKCKDPFTIIVDPDAQEYDPSEWGWVIEQRWIDLDATIHYYGKKAANTVAPFLSSTGIVSALPTSFLGSDIDQIAPWRGFGGGPANMTGFATDFSFSDWVDPYRKTVRLIDCQHYVRAVRNFFTDMETGDRRPIPDNWGPEKVRHAIEYTRSNGQFLMIQRLPTKRLRWTQMIGDTIVYDAWAPHDTPTIIPYFPYFRRGVTRGMVADLVSVQDEINVRRSARLNIIGRTANSGWIYEKGSLDPRQARKLETEGGKPGVNIEWDSKGKTHDRPQQIPPQSSPVSIAELEHEAAADLPQIAGINAAALGQMDGANTSGEALRARQGQTVIGLEGFQDNYHQTQRLSARKDVELIQQNYTQERIIRVIGENATDPLEVIINQATAMGIVNRVDIGNYDIILTDKSMMDSFLAQQFEELMRMRDAGIPIPPSFIVDASTFGKKDELKIILQQQAAMGIVDQPGGGGAAPAAGGAPAGGQPTPSPMGSPQ